MRRRVPSQMRGFTLLELSVAMALAGLVGTVAVLTLKGAADQARIAEQRNLTDGEAKVVLERMAFVLRGIGGNGLLPRAALWLRNDVGGGEDTFGNELLAMGDARMPNPKPGTDAIVFVYPQEDFPPCVVRQRVGGSQQLAVSGTRCCEGGAVTGQPLLFISSSGRVSARLRSTGRTCAVGGCQLGCSLTFDATVGDLDDVESELDTAGEVLAGGQLTLESERIGFYVDDDDELVQVRERGGDFESAVLADQILDLQFSPGVDVDGDGRVAGPAGSIGRASDEWLWNAADGNRDALEVGALRMLGFGIVIVGEQQLARTGTRAHVLDGPDRASDHYLRALYGQIGLRNQPEFQ